MEPEINFKGDSYNKQLHNCKKLERNILESKFMPQFQTVSF